MNRYSYILLTILTLTLLSACGNAGRDTDLLTPFPDIATNTGPSNAILAASVKDYLTKSNNPVSSQYEFVRHDLNGDGLDDALVLFKNPYGHWCGLHGCTMLVMKAHRNHFTVVNRIKPIRTPLYISKIKTKGWKDLIVHVSGRQETTKNVALRFDGRQYPTDPSTQTPYPVRYIKNLGPKIFP